MSNIEQNLQKILTSRYGKDVRQSIHDSIHDCYEDGKAGATDLVAREQIANLVANNNPTDGNSELLDIRVGADGTTYKSAGEALRGQISTMSIRDLFAISSIGYIRKGDQLLVKQYPYVHTQPIFCNSNCTIVTEGLDYNNPYVDAITFYDENNNYIGSAESENNITIPENTAYCIVSYLLTNTAFKKFYIYTSAHSNRRPFTLYLDNYLQISNLINEMNNNPKLLETISRKYIPIMNGKNLFNKDAGDIVKDHFLNDDGTPVTDQIYGYEISHYILVEAGEYYITNANYGGAYGCAYDKNFKCIAVTKEHIYRMPENSVYFRISYTSNIRNIIYFEKGQTHDKYEPFYYWYELEKSVQELEDEVYGGDSNKPKTVILPTDLYVIKDYALPIYYENILFKSFHDAGDLYFSSGQRFSRLQKMLLSTSGTDDFSISLIENLKVKQTFNKKIHVTDKSKLSGKTINLLFVGDSFTDIGSYIAEVETLLENAGATVNLIGTCGNSVFKAEGLSGGTLSNTFLTSSAGVSRIVEVSGVTQAPNTGYPGRTYKDSNNNEWIIRGSKIMGNGSGKMVVTKYGAVESDFTSFPTSGVLTKVSEGGEGDEIISYSNPIKGYYNPFINPETHVLDISYYLSYWGFPNPDVVIFQFTWNDFGTWAADSVLNKVVNNFKSAVDHVHSNLPNAKIILSIEPYGPPAQDNNNRDWNGKKYAVLLFAEKMIEMFESEEYKSFVTIAPSYACVDLINAYSSSEVVPSDRYPDIKEISGGDGVHPGTGMLQISDCLYPIIAYHLTN